MPTLCSSWSVRPLCSSWSLRPLCSSQSCFPGSPSPHLWVPPLFWVWKSVLTPRQTPQDSGQLQMGFFVMLEPSWAAAWKEPQSAPSFRCHLLCFQRSQQKVQRVLREAVPWHADHRSFPCNPAFLLINAAWTFPTPKEKGLVAPHRCQGLIAFGFKKKKK